MEITHKMLLKFLLESDNKKNITIILLLISSSILFRFFYLPYEIPIFLDSFEYFNYALQISQTGNLPVEYFPNNGWPTFLSLFFSILDKENFFDFV